MVNHSLIGYESQYRVKVLGAAASSVGHFAAAVHDDHVRGGWDLVRPRADPLSVVQGAERRLMLVQIAPHPLPALIDGDIDPQKLDLRAVLGLRGTNLRQQLLAQFAPGCPEFEKEGLLTNIPTQVDHVAVEVRDRDHWRLRADRDPGFLSGQRGRYSQAGEKQPDQPVIHSTRPILTK